MLRLTKGQLHCQREGPLEEGGAGSPAHTSHPQPLPASSGDPCLCCVLGSGCRLTPPIAGLNQAPSTTEIRSEVGKETVNTRAPRKPGPAGLLAWSQPAHGLPLPCQQSSLEAGHCPGRHGEGLRPWKGPVPNPTGVRVMSGGSAGGEAWRERRPAKPGQGHYWASGVESKCGTNRSNTQVEAGRGAGGVRGWPT